MAGFTFELVEVELVDGLQDRLGVDLEVELGGDARLELELLDEPRVDLSHAPDQRTRHLHRRTHRTHTHTHLCNRAPAVETAAAAAPRPIKREIPHSARKYIPVQNLARRRQASKTTGKSDKESTDLSPRYSVILKNFQFKTWHKSQNLTEVWEDETQMSTRRVNSLPPQQSITTATVHQEQSPLNRLRFDRDITMSRCYRIPELLLIKIFSLFVLFNYGKKTARRSGISQQFQCFYIASKFNACVVLYCFVLVQCVFSFTYLLRQL